MDANVEVITPLRARAMLSRNPVNRTLSPGRVRAYAKAIERGDWVLNGEAIKFNGDGSLLDGQHRLAAIIESETAIESLVVRGVATDAQPTLDIGAKRTLGDLLSMRGETSANMFAAALRIVHAYETMAVPVPYVVPSAQRLTPTMGLEVLDRHPHIRAYYHPRSVPGFSASVATAFGYIFSYVDPADAQAFFAHLAEGTGEKGSAVYALRERMVKHLMLHQPLSEMQRAAITFRAFNHWREGTITSKLMSWKGGGASPDRFPRLNETSFPFRLLPESVSIWKKG